MSDSNAFFQKSIKSFSKLIGRGVLGNHQYRKIN